MNISFNDYREKVKACWLGKNIGGTLGAPLEGRRGIFNVTYYTHDLSIGVLPNDDLDLQLVWLLAAENYGQKLNSEILGEYWLTYITADWSEYGTGKGNMRFGLLPPVSGRYHNPYGNSCGCFIRSEIWACLAPGHPEIATKYAYEDAITDHTDEGVYAELFCAAVESAAFIESDTRKLIEIGLSYIPADCMVAKCVKAVIDCYDNGQTWQEARKTVLTLAPSTFGARYPELDDLTQDPIGSLGFDAPNNIGIIIIGWLYGEGDFSNSICIATNCGEDTDCTAGTLGAIMGIVGRRKIIDEKWLKPIGEEIKTIAIDRTKEPFPKTVTELTDRVTRLMPAFMHGFANFDDTGILNISTTDSLLCPSEYNNVFYYNTRPYSDNFSLSSLYVAKDGPLFEAKLAFEDISIANDTEKKLTLHLKNKFYQPQWLKLKWYLPEEWTITSGKEGCMLLDQEHSQGRFCEKSFTIIPQNLTQGKYELTLEISCEGRPSKLYIPFVFINE